MEVLFVALLFLVLLAALLTSAGFLVFVLAKRMRPEVNKLWPVVLSFVVHTLVLAAFRPGSFGLLAIIFSVHAIVYWRFDKWAQQVVDNEDVKPSILTSSAKNR
jgi:hypothetical protein